MNLNLHKKQIAGVDEVGRGALFGPVFAGAVILNHQAEITLMNAGLKDSKALSSKQRKKLIPVIKNCSLAWALGQASSREIDYEGIRKATEKAMTRALQKLSLPITMVLVDGILPIRQWEGPQKTVIRGDTLYPAIAAASVIAKETRDELIKRLAKKYKNYGLEKNVGYGTKLHREAIITLGVTTLHRQSFLTRIIK